MKQVKFHGLIEFMEVFPDDATCEAHLEKMRWGGKPVCPHCRATKIWKFTKGRHRYKCGECKKIFNVKVGTIFQDTKLRLRKWFIAIYLVTNHKKGISSMQLAKTLAVQQKTAWFLIHRIREMFDVKDERMMTGIVEADETFVGGKAKNKHWNKRSSQAIAKAKSDKTTVFGLLEREGKIKVFKVKDREKGTLLPIIRRYVGEGNYLITDDWAAYRKITGYKHFSVNHSGGEYVNGAAHTNSIEGFFSLLKRAIIGTWHYTSPKHLRRYCCEMSFKYNGRRKGQTSIFNLALRNIEGALPYKVLIEK